MEKQRPDLLYHYTNFVALEGILLKDGLRLHSYKEMNDKKELLHFIEMAEKAVIKRCKLERKPYLIESVKKIFSQQKIKRKNDEVYLASFSEWEDDAAQWERYGCMGQGVAIAFDFEKLKEVTRYYSLICNRVFYGKTADSHNIIDDIMDVLDNHYPTKNGLNDWETIFNNMWAFAAAHKNASFESEKEYRILTLPTWNGKRFDHLGEIQVVTTPAQIKKCLCLNLKEGCVNQNIHLEDLIKKIVIGPKSNVEVNEVKSWLSANGSGMLGKHVHKSSSSLC